MMSKASGPVPIRVTGTSVRVSTSLTNSFASSGRSLKVRLPCRRGRCSRVGEAAWVAPLILAVCLASSSQMVRCGVASSACGDFEPAPFLCFFFGYFAWERSRADAGHKALVDYYDVVDSGGSTLLRKRWLRRLCLCW